MPEAEILSSYAVPTEPMTVRIERMLPGPIERAWAWLTESDLRRRWLAAGEMDLRVGGRVDLIWRNDELTDHQETRPEGFDEEHRMQNVITRIDAPRLLAFGWGESAEVTFELEPAGDEVRLTLTHRRLPSRAMMVMVGAGWHAHLDLLVAGAKGEALPPFWSHWLKLRAEYEARLPHESGMR
ncbi:SRPBCC family protein [Plastoroseomonas arctica]|uniref:SRPBCC family protein n=1 Tax=Plastoroseomonas arctica TaxID=1509237 RepID=A0AAF1KKL1_9PROT|nr:SRPBCC family protein [Plastoroseomonas arctica]MBR0656670.1 SRPBCC family protein [Plastoroseomonas arctica]